MHSIRETCGVLDFYYYDKLFKEFFASYDKIDQKLLGYWFDIPIVVNK